MIMPVTPAISVHLILKDEDPIVRTSSWACAVLLTAGLFLMQSGCAGKPASNEPPAKAPPATKGSTNPGGAEVPATPGEGK